MTENKQKLTAKQQIAIGALLASSTIAMAAEASNIAERTLYRWLTLEHFKAAYDAARRQLVEQALSKTQGAMARAVDTLQNVMDDQSSPASSRVAASRTVLDFGLRSIELQEIERRIMTLEAKIGGQNL